MGKFNLNNPTDFARLTLSTASSALNQLAGATQSKWDIDEAAYGHPSTRAGTDSMVLFHVFKSGEDYDAAVDRVEEVGGRRKASFAFPYLDGQTTDDLGRRGETYTFNVLIHGPNYKKAYDRLIKEFNDPRPGTLVHPVRGRLTVAVSEWSTTHESNSRKAVTMRVTFIEHNFDVSFTRVDKTFKGALSQAVGFFSKIDAILTKVESNLLLIQTVKNIITSSVSAYKTNYAQTLGKLNTTFNTGSTDDIPSLLPTNTDGENSTYNVAQSPNDPLSGVPQEEISSQTFQALAVEQAIDQVKVLRAAVQDSINQLSNCLDGEGSLEFRDDIVTLKESSKAAQDILELGIQTSNAKILTYKVPRIMSVREVAFESGIQVDRSIEIELLNPLLLSFNYIPKGTLIKVPSA